MWCDCGYFNIFIHQDILWLACITLFNGNVPPPILFEGMVLFGCATTCMFVCSTTFYDFVCA